MKFVQITALFSLLMTGPHASAFQIAPLGSKLEARLTNETDSSLARMAGRLGFLIKEPVHEEITQLGFDCPVDRKDLGQDDSCRGGDAGYANPFIIYGVRWNDLPPFLLGEGQGRGCASYGAAGKQVCDVRQTVRFATQPACWLCLFFEAKAKGATKKITHCDKGPGYEQGTLMTRSHFGDLQFLHAMASEEGTDPQVTRRKILDWTEFAWRVFTKEIQPGTFLKTIENPTIRQHFGCSDWSVSDIYILGRTARLQGRIDDIAFGSILHTVQDSFAAGHATREAPVAGATCSATLSNPKPGRIIQFHTYAAQDSHKHDEGDFRSAMATNARDRWPDAVEATKGLFQLYNANASWETARPYFECLFDLSPDSKPSSPGDAFRRVAQ
jgi:hypothetical protein